MYSSEYYEDEGEGEGEEVPDRNETKTPDSVKQFMREMRKPRNWIDQAFG